MYIVEVKIHHICCTSKRIAYRSLQDTRTLCELLGYRLGLLRSYIIDPNLRDYRLTIWCLNTEMHSGPGLAL